MANLSPTPRSSTAARLRAQRDVIQAQWLERVRGELAAARDQTEPGLLDNLPKILEALAEALEGKDRAARGEELFSRHAEARIDWSSYSAEELMREYGLLRRVLFSVLEQEQPLAPEERDEILEFIEQGVQIGSARFSAMQRVHERLELQYLKLIEHLVVESGRAGALSSGLERLLDVVLLGLGAEAAAFFLYSGNTLDVTLSSAAARAEPLAEAYRAAFALSSARAQNADQSAGVHLVRVADLDREARESLGKLHVELLVMVKIDSPGGAPGTLCLGFAETRAFDPNEIRLLAALGDRLALLLASLELQEQSVSALERVRLQSDMLEAERNSLDEERRRRDELIAAISHDLKNPLSTARLGAELIRRGAASPGAATEKLANQILTSITRSDRMIHDLLDCQRIRAGKRLPLDMQEYRMNDLVATVVEDMARLHGPRFVVDTNADVTGVWSWEGMRRVLENLLSNAVKYSAPQSPITLSLGVGEGNTMRLSVHNEGAALSSEDQARIFRPFERGSSAEHRGKRGWGIGLTLVQGIVDAHGGTVSVDSTPQGGTTFTINNPMDSRPHQPD